MVTWEVIGNGRREEVVMEFLMAEDTVEDMAEVKEDSEEAVVMEEVKLVDGVNPTMEEDTEVVADVTEETMVMADKLLPA